MTRPVDARRAHWLVGGGAVLLAAGQLVAFGDLGSLRILSLLSLEAALLLQDAALAATAVGYLAVVAGYVLYGRASESG